jgi:hypothetical protein
MELLIPGLILVALMAWASTKIKKRAADAFEAENIETEDYLLKKPEGFLHVLGDPDHEFYAYSREFGEQSSSTIRRGVIEIDVLRGASIADVRNSIKEAADEFEVIAQTPSECELETQETANEVSLRGFYKVVRSRNGFVRLRFAVLAEHTGEFSERVKSTLDSFSVRTN